MKYLQGSNLHRNASFLVYSKPFYIIRPIVLLAVCVHNSLKAITNFVASTFYNISL